MMNAPAGHCRVMLSTLTPLFPGKTLFNVGRVGWEHRVKPLSRVPRKRVSPLSLQKFGPMSPRPGCPVSPGSFMLSGSLKTLFSSKAILTPASSLLLLCRQNRGDFRSRCALLQTGGLAEMCLQISLFLVCCCATGSVMILGPRPSA